MAILSKKNKKHGSILLSRNVGFRSKVDARQSRSQSSKVGRTVIHRHHMLQKQLAQAKARNDVETAQALKAKIDASGGLEKYQQASILGQSVQRGGDSSKVLMHWIHELENSLTIKSPEGKIRMLEVGSLSSENDVSKCTRFDVTRIDLNSCDPSIKSQDFMERPLPKSEIEEFDIISLSLVLNYVPEAIGRGDMLRQTTRFLQSESSLDPKNPISRLFPSLFLVLPASCLKNSRYLNETKLEVIMGSIGYSMVKRKFTAKLAYSLWRLIDTKVVMQGKKFKKTEVNPGRTRNNFAIVLN